MKKLGTLLIALLLSGSAFAQTVGSPSGGGGGGGSGTVTNVATGTGLSGGPITTTGTITCGQATSAAFGCVKVDGTTVTATGGVISATGTPKAGSNLEPRASNFELLRQTIRKEEHNLDFRPTAEEQSFRQEVRGFLDE